MKKTILFFVFRSTW